MPSSKNKRRPEMSDLWPWSQMLIAQKSNPPAMPDVYQTMMQVGQEFMDLCRHRNRAYSDLQREIINCKNPEEFDELAHQFWNDAYHQYRDYSAHAAPGPLAIFGGILDGQVATTLPGTSRTRSASRAAPKSASKARAKTASKTRANTSAKRKSPARRKPTDNRNALYSYPEHVEGRHENRGRIH